MEENFSRGFLCLIVAKAVALAEEAIEAWKDSHPFHGALRDSKTPIGYLAERTKLMKEDAANDFKHQNAKYFWQKLVFCQELEMAARDLAKDQSGYLREVSVKPIDSADISADVLAKKVIMAKPYSGKGVDFENRCGRVEARCH